MRPTKIGLIAHTGKSSVAELIRALGAEFEHFKLPVVLGGDGTILSVVGQLGDLIKPIFGINVGSLGFLTCANSSASAEAVDCIATGKMVFSNRTLLEATVQVAGKISTTMTGLNDAVLSRGEVSR